MLRRRGSKMPSFASSSNKTKIYLSPPPTPKPGRTLVLPTAPSMMRENEPPRASSLDTNQSYTIDTVFPTEPLFHDLYIPTNFSGDLKRSAKEKEIKSPEETSFSRRMSSLRWSVDIESRDYSSEDEDDFLDSLCQTPPNETYLATEVTIIHAGKPKLIDVFPLHDHLKQHSPLPYQTDYVSRRSSSSTRDFSVSSYGRSSDSGSRPSPASSISEYSNLVYERIPEDCPLESNPHPEIDLRPFRHGFHRRNASSNSKSSIEIAKPPEIGEYLAALDIPSSPWANESLRMLS